MMSNRWWWKVTGLSPGLLTLVERFVYFGVARAPWRNAVAPTAVWEHSVLAQCGNCNTVCLALYSFKCIARVTLLRN